MITASITSVGGLPGLSEGLISNTGALDATTLNPANSSIQLYPRLGETGSNGATAPWGNNQTWVYTGQFYDSDG
jgi:hypothetical protein